MKKAVTFALFLYLTSPLVQAAGIDVSVLPVPNPQSGKGAQGIVADVYQFALMIGGILAFAVIVWGAIRYTLAAGNPSAQSEGKEWIRSALLGLLLLLGVYLILNTISPNLTKLELPTLGQIKAPSSVGSCGGSGPICDYVPPPPLPPPDASTCPPPVYDCTPGELGVCQALNPASGCRECTSNRTPTCYQ